MEKIKCVLMALLLVACCAHAWEDCPFGRVNDPYPGECGRYIDTNQDGICDKSQTMPTTTVPEHATTTTKGTASTTTTLLRAPQKPATGQYYLVPLCAALLTIYLISDLLSRKNIFYSVCGHRKIWNILLFFTFFAAAATGLLLAVRLDQRWDVPLILEVTFWHVETGIAMSLIALFHCAWHWKYYLTLFKEKKQK